MWTFDNFPIAAANAASARGSTRRGSTGAAGVGADRRRVGRVVSPEGLILTNEHVASRPASRICRRPSAITSQTGFTPAIARRRAPCPGMIAEILTDIGDVTQRMQAAGAGLDRRGLHQGARCRGGRGSRARPAGRTRRAPLPGGDAVSRRPFQALHLSPLHRRPARLRARASRRGVRRRSRQFQLSALRGRCGVPPPLRERPAGEDAGPFPLERRPAAGEPAGVPVGQPGRDPAAADAGAAAHGAAT